MDKRTKARIRKTVHKAERDRGRQTVASQTYKPPLDGMVPFVLQSALIDTTWSYGRRRRWANPRDPSSVAWETDTQDVRIYPWKIPSDKQIDSGREVWCAPYGGRWVAVVPEECLDTRT